MVIIVKLHKKVTSWHPSHPHLSDNMVIVLIVMFETVGVTTVHLEVLTTCGAILVWALYL